MSASTPQMDFPSVPHVPLGKKHSIEKWIVIAPSGSRNEAEQLDWQLILKNNILLPLRLILLQVST